MCISIHAPHEGERHGIKSISKMGRDFNPRSPRGGATRGYTAFAHRGHISIHAPHEGERLSGRQIEVFGSRISIHAPHEGERLAWMPLPEPPKEDFNPRSPRGGATLADRDIIAIVEISIHAPHEGERRWPMGG